MLIGGLRMLYHRCVGLEQDVDGSDRIRLTSPRLHIPGQRGQQTDGQCGQNLQASMHVSLRWLWPLPRNKSWDCERVGIALAQDVLLSRLQLADIVDQQMLFF